MRTTRNTRRRLAAGFTLVEMMIVMVVIGVLASIAVPNYYRYRRHAKVARTAEELRSFSTAFVAYMAERGSFPPDSHLTLPPGMQIYIDPIYWSNETPIGGHYNWEGPDTYPYAGISVFGSTEPPEVFQLLDHLLDDGDLTRGQFRSGTGGRPTFIIQEMP